MAKQKAIGQVRVIGGLWRGRKLPVPDSLGLRPTTDRVKETLFNWLMPIINGSKCLDCFAGSGSLGIEALSRYANEVTLLELQHTVCLQLKKNLQQLNVKNGYVIQANTLEWLKQSGTPFNVVFIDPPFRLGLLTEIVSLLEENQWLAHDAWIYIETESESQPVQVPKNWLLYREKVAGQVAYRLYRRTEGS